MNAFYEHHKSSIEFGYRCFDRILLNGLIQPSKHPEGVMGFFNPYRDGKRVTRHTLTEIADQFHHWVTNRSRSSHCVYAFAFPYLDDRGEGLSAFKNGVSVDPTAHGTVISLDTEYRQAK